MRTILISGASRGIGKSIAEKALEDGHRISLGIRNPEAIKGTRLDPKNSDSNRILISYYDALNINTGKDWIDKTIKEFKSFDSIVHCAGIFKGTKVNCPDSEIKDLEELWRINVLAPWMLTRDAWDYLIKSNKGRVIFLVSMSGKRSKGNLAGYSMSKFALMGVCQTIRNEGWDHGLRVTAICPGWVNTDMASKITSISKDEMTQPKDIASITTNLLSLSNSCIPFEIKVNCCLEK